MDTQIYTVEIGEDEDTPDDVLRLLRDDPKAVYRDRREAIRYARQYVTDSPVRIREFTIQRSERPIVLEARVLLPRHKRKGYDTYTFEDLSKEGESHE